MLMASTSTVSVLPSMVDPDACIALGRAYASNGQRLQHSAADQYPLHRAHAPPRARHGLLQIRKLPSFIWTWMMAADETGHHTQHTRRRAPAERKGGVGCRLRVTRTLKRRLRFGDLVPITLPEGVALEEIEHQTVTFEVLAPSHFHVQKG